MKRTRAAKRTSFIADTSRGSSASAVENASAPAEINRPTAARYMRSLNVSRSFCARLGFPAKASLFSGSFKNAL